MEAGGTVFVLITIQIIAKSCFRKISTLTQIAKQAKLA